MIMYCKQTLLKVHKSCNGVTKHPYNNRGSWWVVISCQKPIYLPVGSMCEKKMTIRLDRLFFCAIKKKKKN